MFENILYFQLYFCICIQIRFELHCYQLISRSILKYRWIIFFTVDLQRMLCRNVSCLANATGSIMTQIKIYWALKANWKWFKCSYYELNVIKDIIGYYFKWAIILYWKRSLLKIDKFIMYWVELSNRLKYLY